MLLVAAAAGVGGFAYGKKSVKPMEVMTDAGLTLPKDAVVTTECANGLGKQFIESKNIPNGPLYNVHDGKVIGLEMMFNASEIKANPSRFTNVDLGDHSFKYLRIESVVEGHAGNTEPHYHLDFFTEDKTMVDAIKCSTTDTNMTDMHTSSNPNGHATH